MLGKSEDVNAFIWLGPAMRAIGPHLDPARKLRCAKAFVAPILSRSAANDLAQYADPLVALLDPGPRGELSTKTTAVLLEFGNIDGMVRSMISPRSLAKLLSHPACVGEQRDALLKRFEELVFYDGKPVFLKADNPEAQQPTQDQGPPRRFHNLHDAAAWIQQNWPDFDLETNYLATWRSSP
jgi:hypothetical protein